MPLTESAHGPRATYRVQLHAQFNFAALRKQADWIRALGVSEVYLSPIFTAAPGSQHGYDVSDYRSINAELGGREGFAWLSDQLRHLGLGVLVDFVPNHMGIAGPLNLWWRDVLENGRQSAFADYFDIQWKTANGERHSRVLVPRLRDHYGRELERGAIKVGCDGEFSIRYGDTSWPVNPASYTTLLDAIAEDPRLDGKQRAELARLARAFAASPPAREAGRDTRRSYAAGIAQAKTDLRSLWAGQPAVAECTAACLREINGVRGHPASFARLDALLEQQHYRLARWKNGAHEINYRRFFAIDSLVGLHMENPEVFHAAHRLLRELLAEGRVDGLRIDHIDGLRDPEKYLASLQTLKPAGGGALYVVVEKILARGELLPDRWPVHGTTGYDFIPQLADLFVDAAAERRFDQIYQAFTGDCRSFADAVYATKRLIIAEMFANAVNNLGADLTQLVARDWHWRDLTRHELTTAVSETLTELNVYRTYRTAPREASAADRQVLEAACAQAIGRNPLADPQPVEFLRDVLTGDYPPATAPDDYQREIIGWVKTFQQQTGAIAAKSVEDTAYYTFCRLIALNEVGGDPARFGGTLDDFHDANTARLQRMPSSLLTTSTHDTKLSEDVRARLYALSEIPEEWADWLAQWHEWNAGHRTADNGREFPDARDEYRFYQVLLGVWPLDGAEAGESFRQRLRAHMRKAVDEAKRHTSMLHPNESYFTACDRFVDGAVTAACADTAFGTSFRHAARRIARLGMINSLSQVVLKCTVPGVPDFYQGNESWDFSLVDPDNRRPVDYARLQSVARAHDTRSVTELLGDWHSGAIKLRVMSTLLHFRAARARVFTAGGYTPVIATGEFSDRVAAFTRDHGEEKILVVVPRLTAKLGAPPLAGVWDDTCLRLGSDARAWHDLFTGRKFAVPGEWRLSDLLRDLPFAVLATPFAPPR